MFHAIAALLSAGVGLNLLLLLILLPAAIGAVIFIIPKQYYIAHSACLLLALVVNALLTAGALVMPEYSLYLPWAGTAVGINFALRIYDFSQLLLFLAAIVALLVGLFSLAYMRRKSYGNRFFFYYLLNLAMFNSALLSNNMVVLLFFGEGMLFVLFAMLLMNQYENHGAAKKALVINACADLLLMLGACATCFSAGSTIMTDIVALPLTGTGQLGFVCMMLGAVGKIGAMPFHSWLPTASRGALPSFLAIVPASLQKLLGVYLLTRLCFDFYDLQPGSAMSILLLTIGGVSVVVGGAMALIQNDGKKMLSYLTIALGGYMIVGIGSLLPNGVIGGVLYMISSLAFMPALFLCLGAVEYRTGTTDLRLLSGVGRFMPLTGVCFFVAAFALLGLPPANGFLPLNLILYSAMGSGTVFYLLAIAGIFLMAAALIKACHAIFMGKTMVPDTVEADMQREAPGAMLIAVALPALAAIVLGLFRGVLLQPLQMLFGDTAIRTGLLQGHFGFILVAILVVLLALGNHVIGYRATGSPERALDHFRFSPPLRPFYTAAERGYFDPYHILTVVVGVYAWICLAVERAVNWFYDVLFVRIFKFCTAALHEYNSGSPTRHIAWAFTGVGFLLLLVLLLV